MSNSLKKYMDCDYEHVNPVQPDNAYKHCLIWGIRKHGQNIQKKKTQQHPKSYMGCFDGPKKELVCYFAE